MLQHLYAYILRRSRIGLQCGLVGQKAVFGRGGFDVVVGDGGRMLWVGEMLSC